MDTATTRSQLIAHAQRLIQERGYNGFSYRDLADLVGIRTASIHYYFPQKEDLLLAVIEAYRKRWREHVCAIPADLPALEKLRRYMDIHWRAFLGTPRICLAGALASGLGSLPECVRESLQALFLDNETWLVGVLEQGREDGSIDTPQGDLQGAARAIYAALQGGLAVSRLFGSSERLDDLPLTLAPAATA